MDIALLLAVAATCYLGFALLALSQDRHWHHVHGARNCPSNLIIPLRAVGFAFLLVAFVLALCRDGASFGSLLWATMISVGAFAVVATLSWRARWLRPIARLCHPASVRSG